MKKGFSFVEIVLAAVIAVLLIVPLVALFRQSVQETQQSFDEIQAMLLARSALEEVKTICYQTGMDRITPIGNHKKEGFVDMSQVSDYYSLFGSGIRDTTDRRTALAHSVTLFTPLPKDYRRLIRLYPANRGSQDRYIATQGLYQLEVKVEWKTYQASDFNRSVNLHALLDFDEVLP